MECSAGPRPPRTARGNMASCRPLHVWCCRWRLVLINRILKTPSLMFSAVISIVRGSTALIKGATLFRCRVRGFHWLVLMVLLVGVIFLQILVHICGCFWAFREKPCYSVHLSSRINVVHFLGLMFETRGEPNEAIVNIASWHHPFVLP